MQKINTTKPINPRIGNLNKLLFCYLFFVLSALSFGQDNPNPESYYSPEGIFDKVFDKEGTVYKLSDIAAGKSYVLKSGATVTNTLLCTSGIFELYFETGCGMDNTANALENQRRAVLCQAFQDISDFINTPLKNVGNTNKVRIWIRNPANLTPAMPAAAAGAASAFYSLPTGTLPTGTTANPNIGGIVDNEIWKTIHTGANSYTNSVFPIITTENLAGFYHGWAVFNFGGTVNWNLDYSKTNAGNGYVLGNVDFYSTIIHEITHALGFNSLINFNGGSQLMLTQNGLFGSYFTRYDKYLKTPASGNLISNVPLNSGQMYDFSFIASSTTLRPSCTASPPINNGNSGLFNCTTSLKYISSITVPVYTPPCFENGSSLSHFEDACYNGNTNDQFFMMSDRASGTFAKRFLTPEERQVLCDIGYTVNGTFGSIANLTYKNYGVSTCPGVTVGGVNDGIPTSGTYPFQGNSGANITISGILNNDYTGGLASNFRFEFVQDLYDPNAIFSATSGTTSTSFTFKSYVPGVHLLRYVPFDNATGQRGNITYIFVNVLNNCVQNNPCSLVRNGNFEEHNYAPNTQGQIYKACGWQNASYRPTADYYNSDSTAPANTITGINPYSVPCNTFGNQVDQVAGNHGYVGMYISPNRINLLENTYSESIKTELMNTLVPNTTYQLTFDVSLAEQYSKKSIKFQMLISDTNYDLTTGGIIPSAYLTANTIFLTNPTFSNAAAASPNGWQTITFNFTTNSNPNLKYLYIGGLSNVQFNNEAGIVYTTCGTNPSAGTYNSGESYYYVDNVNLTRVLAPNFIDAVNDNFTSMPINGVTGGVTTSVYANDLYNSTASTSASLPYVTFSLVTPIAISGATINSSGLITVPAGTAPGTYTLTYRLSTVGNCNVTDTATVTILVTSNTTPPLVAGIRANNAVNHVELQSTNKSIISGYFTTYNNLAAPRIARLNTDLTLDLTFVSSGPNPSNYPPMDLVVQPDDKVIVAGGFSGFSGGSNGFGIARLLANGAIDTAYNVGGAGTAGNVGYTNNTPYALAQQSDGKILLGGDFYYYNGTQRLGIVRINTNGSVDTSFVPTELNSYYRSVVTGITLQPDGKMILLGFFSPPVAGATQKNILRLNANGTLDTTFSAGDTAGSLVYNVDLSVSLYSPIAKAVVQPDGKIIIAGAFNKYNGNNVKCLVRLTSTGAIDSSFNTTTGVERAINELILEPSTNKPLIGGEFTTFGTTPVKKLIRLTTTGALDTSFNIGTGTTDSVVYAGCPYCSNYVKVLKQQPDGKIIVGGKFTTFNGLSATNITRIFGAAGAQAKSIYTEYQSEPEIDINTSDAIAFYPNPSDGIYYFNLIDESNDTSLHVFNLVGEKVFSTVLSANQENEVNLSHLAKGCYLVKLSNATSTSTQKLIKN